MAHLRHPQDAGRLMGFAAHYWVSHFGPMTAGDRFDVRRVRRLLAQQLGAPASVELLAEGERISLADAVAIVRRS